MERFAIFVCALAMGVSSVKSLTTTRGSMAETPEGISTIVSQIERYRGGIEGGVCVRRREEFVAGTERRFFVLNGKPFSGDDHEIPTAVAVAAQRVSSPFFSVDVAERCDGVLRIIEIGDGQVSDRKLAGGALRTDAREYLAKTVATIISAGTLWTSVALHGLVPKKGFKPARGMSRVSCLGCRHRGH